MSIRKTMIASVLAVFSGVAAQAEGELNIFHWGNYTNPELIKKFEKEHDVKINFSFYDSNETMYAKLKSGAAGFDVVVPTDYMVAIMLKEGMLQPVGVNKMENFKNIDPRWIDVYWDPGREYSVPWQWGTTAFAVNTAKYDGDINTLKILFDPPAELSGRINMLEDMPEVINAGLRYLGYSRCNSNKEELRDLYKLLMDAKQHWRTIDSASIEKLTSGDVDVSHSWSGASMRARLKVPTIKYAYPREGLTGWMDNVAVLKDAPNVENAKLFLNFLMEPENAALVSDFARYANGILGSEEFMDPEMKDAPEVHMPADAPVPDFVQPCDKDVIAAYTKIWTEIKK